MAERRIRVPKEKAEFIEELLKTGKGPFETKAQLMGFAAAYGAKFGERMPLEHGSSEPIHYRTFLNEKLDTLINLLAIAHTGDPKVLARNDEMEELRILIFEEFSNRGLALLAHKLKGESKFTQSLLLFMKETQTNIDEISSLVGIFS